MKRVLFVCNYKPKVGGISGQVEILQRKLREEGYKADIFSTKASVWKRLRLLPQLRRKVREYDIVHVHCCSEWGFLPAVMGVSVGKRLGKRVVLTYHGGGGESFFDKHPKLVHRYLTRTDANIVLSGFLARIFEKHHLPYVIIPNIVDLDSSLFRERIPLRPRFVCIRAHEELYNIPCILRAFQQVQIQIPEATLMLVGAGTLHEDLIQQVEQMKLPNVTFTGRVDNSEIVNYLDQADIMLSAPKVDNMPVSLIEAMNVGLFIVSSNVGGVPYMIEDGKSGLLFESDNDVELAEKMLWALNHQLESKEIIMRAFQSVKKYSWENVRDQLISLYKNEFI
ncbi:MAG: glycosyltransferase family 4 protein [Bacteroidales bacterium]|nr:glycosyltransferase family 4 protein [Bacteroidales bacterium]